MKRILTNYNLIKIAILIIIIFMAFGGVGSAYAADTSYRDVLSDLQQDENFKASEYPSNAKDYSLKVIQVAESTDGELFLYVYQPCQLTTFLVATKINMSLSETADNTQLYNLKYLNSVGVFVKYRVEGVTVRSNKLFRFYNISSIYRDFKSSIDDNADKQEGDNLTNSVAFRVGKIFTASTIDNKIVYSQEPTYTVEIINPFVDYLICAPSHYSGGLWWWQEAKWALFDSHFIAFSTDWDIDRLVSADISYAYCSGSAYYDELFGFELNAEVSYGDVYNDSLTVDADEKNPHTDSIHGITYNTYSWNKINSAADFISQVSTSKGISSSKIAELEKNLSDKEWVINFIETERTQKDTNVVGVYKKYTSNFTKVSNVTILRLEFETDGKVYNLGAVSNAVSSTRYPEEGSWHWYDGIVDFFTRIKDFFTNLTWWQWLLLIIGVVLAVGLVIAIVKFGISTVIKVFGLVLKKLGQAVWWVISRPFVWIASIVRKRKEAAPAKTEPSKSRKKRTHKTRTTSHTRKRKKKA